MRIRREAAEDLHGADFFEWSEIQARLLASLRARYPDLPGDLDIDAIAEEIEDLGRAELNAVESHIRNIVVHLLKAASEPKSAAMAHWRTETTVFHADLVQRYSASMRQRIDMNRCWRLGLRIARDSLRERGLRLVSPLPEACPFLLDDLIDEGFEFDPFRQRLAERIESGRQA